MVINTAERTKTSGKGSINSLEEVDQKGQKSVEFNDSVNQALRRQRQKNCFEFKTSLGYTLRSKFF